MGTRLAARVLRMTGRYANLVPVKKGPTESRYSLRARQIINKRNPGGDRWQRIKDLGKDAA